MSNLHFGTNVYPDCEDKYHPVIDDKRPFGNSDLTGDVCEIMEWQCDGESGEYTAENIEKAETLLIELPVALEIVTRNHTFEPGEYETDKYGAYFNYVLVRNYHALKNPLKELETKYGDCGQIRMLRKICTNITGDDPWAVTDELKSFPQTDFVADTVSVFEKYRRSE